ncbi:MAG: LacI family DNA-binding transcriptional regulator [Treponema sp.]|nr:LacI family DNA-binding transcriptional regulator [Treponema sp.]
MRKSEVSSKDIAEACGVSRTTVSFVLNNTPGKVIPSETRERILEAARRLGYSPDAEARSIAKRTRATIGLVVNHSDSIYADAYILRLIEGMAPVFNKKRCRLVLLPLRQREADYGQIVRAHGLDGLMITNARADDEALRALAGLGLPCVVIGTVEGIDAPQIDIDNEEAAFRVADYLLSLGHRRVAMIVHAPLSYVAATGRLAGYRRALESHHINYDERLVRVADYTEASGYAAARSILAERPRPEALFAGNDAIAYGAVQAILDEGLRIPDDISIAGFDDDFPSRFLEPALTTMTLPAAALGEGAATKVIALLDGVADAERRTILPTLLSVRDSCAPPRSAAAP